MTNRNLGINDLLMLLALDDRDGKVQWQASPYLEYALAGAILAELAARDLFRFGPEGVLEPTAEPTPTDSPLLADVIGQMRAMREPQTATGWVATLIGHDDLVQRQMGELVHLGILEEHTESFLWFFHRTRYPTRDLTPEKEIVRQIRAAVLGDGQVEPRLAILIALADGAHLLLGPLTESEIEGRADRLRQINRGTVIGEATCNLIKEAERALYVATSIPFMGIPQV